MRSSVRWSGGTTEEITTASAATGSTPRSVKSGSSSEPYSSAVRSVSVDRRKLSTSSSPR